MHWFIIARIDSSHYRFFDARKTYHWLSEVAGSSFLFEELTLDSTNPSILSTLEVVRNEGLSWKVSVCIACVLDVHKTQVNGITLRGDSKYSTNYPQLKRDGKLQLQLDRVSTDVTLMADLNTRLVDA